MEVKPVLLALPAHLPAPAGDAGTGGFGGGQRAKASNKAPHGQQVAHPAHYFVSSVLIRVNQWLI